MSLNKVILIGNVGKDPDVRYFDSGAAVANFPLATSERGYTLANGTVVPERTEWHNIVVPEPPFHLPTYTHVPRLPAGN